MPAISSADQTTLNTFPQGSKLGMAIFQPESIVTATATGSPAVGQETITLAGKSETETPEKHFTVFAGSAAGLSDGGKARLISLTGSTMVVAPNFIEWQTYPYITIKKVIEPWAILPDLNNDYEDGNIGYTNENTNYHPLGRIGGLGMVGYTNEAVNFWSDSTAMATGATLSSHAWTFPSGSPSSSSSAGTAGSPIAVTWSSATGHTPHYIKYVVTDSNGKTHTRRMPVWIFDEIDDSYCDIRIESMSGSFDSGSWRATITALGDADIAQFPEDAMIVVFAQDHYAGHNTELGGNWQHQERVVFGGWIIRDTVFRDKDTGEVTFDVGGPVEKMKQLLCWPANLEDKSSPDGWHELSTMTADRAAFHIMTEHTTMDQICDVVLSGNTKRFLYIDIPEDDPYTQIQDYIMKPIGANLLSDRQGRIYLDPNINLLPVASRTSTVIYSFDIDDPIRNDPGLSLATEEHSWQVAQVDFVAFGYDGVDPRPYYSLAPGNQYHEGEVRKIDGIRADSQSESNSLSGLYLANENNIWREVKIPVFNWRVFDIAPQEYTELTLVAADTKRGLEWAAQKLICRHVEISYDHKDGKLYVTPSFEKDSFGPAGVTGDYPDEPPTHDGGGISPLPGLPPTMSNNPVDLLIGSDGSGVWYLPVGGTAWENRSGTNTAVNQLGWDPWWFTAEKKGTNNPEEAIIWTCHDGAIYRSSNLGGAWVLKSVGSDPPNTWGDATAPTVEAVTWVQRTDNIHKKDHHYFLGTWQNASSEWRSWILHTTDDGASWSYNALGSVDDIKGLWMDVDSEDGSTIYITVWKGDDTLELQVRDTTSFTLTTTKSLGSCTEAQLDAGSLVAYPYTPTFEKARVYVFGRMDSPAGLSGTHRLIQSTDTGATFTSKETGILAEGTKLIETANSSPYNSLVIGDSYYAPAEDATNGFRGDHGDAFKLYFTPTTATTTIDFEYDWMATPPPSWSVGSTRIRRVSDDALMANLDADVRGTSGAWSTESGSGVSCVLAAGTQYYVQGLGAGGNSFWVRTLLITGDLAQQLGVLTNFRAEGQSSGARTFYGVVSRTSDVPSFHRAAESLAPITDITDLPTGLNNVDSFAIRIDPGTGLASIAIGSFAAQSVMVVQSLDDGATWSDITLNLPTTNPITTCVFV